MILKFPFSGDFKDKLKTYNNNLKQVCEPKPNSGEAIHYVRLKDSDKDSFLRHFGISRSEVSILSDDNEYMPEQSTSPTKDLYDCYSYDDGGL